MAERATYVPRSILERGLRGGEGFNKFTKRVQLAGAVVAAPFAPALSAALLAGGAIDHMQEDYTGSWAKQLERKRRAEIAQKYGPNVIMQKGKPVDRHAAAYEPTQLSERIGAKMKTIVNVKALEEKRAA